MTTPKYEPGHFALAGYAYTESLTNLLVMKGVITEKEKHVVLQVAIDSLRSSENPEFQTSADLIKDINNNLKFE